ncbi:uncharacterized protein HMPREF1541_08123 [Cyphellophora europaea CBS 101466]|uniref:Uncharacterized protein n=1 Tax=Cyphellophora europaea (strain CBS 101466) TaxID=1220924 RepID=W2RN46_CYPE1|nr:uncharacterized protein HMPREF1541_08123 [Cyphellophora europaea CBS 101466]ETN37133.1 hypothetical protein HMPREF1541_08123 [Cyphellophora europaea CBS 101466]
MPFARLDSLPQEVSSPPPPVGRGKFSSHITEPLQELMDALPFQKLFKPLTVARDVKVLERGHWLLEITIARDDHVADARASPTKQEAMQAYSDRFAGATAEERLAKFWQAKSAGVMSDYDFGHEDGAVGKWTEAEFVTFWNNFAGLLCKAKAGWAVRMVRDDVAWGLQQAGTRMVRIRIFTWGEIVGHIYLAIWLSSDKLSVRIPMKWVAGDGQAVIEMSGKKKHKGRLPSWIRKGPEGERGSWGLAAEEEPT